MAEPRPRRRGVITGEIAAWMERFAGLSPDFVLAGGTALSEFYLGHRLSFDLDFFSSRIETVDAAERVLPALLRDRKVPHRIEHPIRGALTAYLGDPGRAWKVQFCASASLRPEAARSVGGIRVAALRNIAEMKWEALDRAEMKDLFDLMRIGRATALATAPTEVDRAGVAIYGLRLIRETVEASRTPPDWFLGNAAAWGEAREGMIRTAHTLLAKMSALVFRRARSGRVSRRRRGGSRRP